MLQINQNLAPAPRWRSARDLAYIPAAQTVNLSGGMQFKVISAVPTFGPVGNFIALILEHDLYDPVQMMEYKNLNDSMTRIPIFCSGPNGSHLVKLRLFGHLICDWPADQMDQEEFEVFIQDADGNALANIFTRRKPNLLKQYHTLACVRDVFEEFGNPEEPFAGPYKQFVEWLEYSLFHGIDHILAYTFEGTDAAVTDLLTPYIESGRATRIHFMEYPQGKDTRQRRVLHDCLFRAKNHASWLLASVDIDEYIRLTSDVYAGATNYLNSMWDAYIEKEKLDRDQIHSFQLSRYRFARAQADEVEITSAWREPRAQRKLRRRAGDESAAAAAPGKYVVNVKVVYDIWIHGISVADEGTRLLEMPETIAFINHYRLDYTVQYKNNSNVSDDPLATVYDDALLSDAPLIEQAIRQRFGEDPKTFLKRLSERHPARAV